MFFIKRVPLVRITNTAVIAATCVRLFLLLGTPWTQSLLENPALRSVVTNPIHTIQHVREAYFWLEHNGGTMDKPYVSHSFHLSPLVLTVLHPVFSSGASAYWQSVIIGTLLILVDIGVATVLLELGQHVLALTNHWEEDLEKQMDPRIQPRWAWVFVINFSTKETKSDGKSAPVVAIIENGDAPAAGKMEKHDCKNATPATDKLIPIENLPELAALAYYSNPVTILACGMQSIHSLWNLLWLLAFLRVCQRKDGSGRCLSQAALLLAAATHIDIFFASFTLPMALWIRRDELNLKKSRDPSSGPNDVSGFKGPCAAFAGFFIFWFVALQFLSYILVGEAWSVMIAETYGHMFGFVKLSPNLGVTWYLFAQIFQSFRRYFVLILNGIPYTLMTPLAIRMWRYPQELATSFVFLWILCQSTPTLHHLSVAFCVLLLLPRALIRMGNPTLFSIFSLPVPIILYLLDYWMWLETGSGNANYMFFQCFAYNLFLGIIFLDFVASTVRRDKALRLTEKTAAKDI